MWLLRRLFGKKDKSHSVSGSVAVPGLSQEAIDRNERAHKLENSGRLDEAIKLYERSVRESFIGSFPYTRLRIIYTKQKRYDDAIRVCQKYVDNPYLQGGGKTKGRAGFRKWITKLKAKQR